MTKVREFEFEAGPHHRSISEGDIVQSFLSGVKGQVVAVAESRVSVALQDEHEGCRFFVGDRVAGPAADMTVTAVH